MEFVVVAFVACMKCYSVNSQHCRPPGEHFSLLDGLGFVCFSTDRVWRDDKFNLFLGTGCSGMGEESEGWV